MAARRGLLIVFEGCDRSGKSTQAKKLVEALKSRKQNAKFMSFPDRRTIIGGMIGDYLQNKKNLDDHAVHLAFSANRWEFYEEMKADLKNGTTLVVDRYAYSGVAYTTAKGYSIDWCKGPDRGLVAPDVVFYLDAPLKTIAARGGYGDERYETNKFQEKVYNAYKELEDASWKLINGDRDIDDIHKEIVKLTSELEEPELLAPLGSLWTEQEIKEEKITGKKRKQLDTNSEASASKTAMHIKSDITLT